VVTGRVRDRISATITEAEAAPPARSVCQSAGEQPRSKPQKRPPLVRARKSAAHQALGKTIRSAREQARYSHESFARHAGLDRAYYGAIERGVFNVTLETLLKITAGLNSSVGELYTRARI
jgi:DNA-binding XRE family transcriptional regulator